MIERRRHRLALPEGFKLLWYRIGKVLGQGGFGITYLAEDTNLKRQVAIKEFLPSDMVARTSDGTVEPLSDEHAEMYSWCFERFTLEAQTLARFHHPGIVHVLSVFEANSTAYMVMTFVEGETLDAALSAGRIQDEAQLRKFTDKLLDGLELVHDQGFIHRDIKPANILVRPDGSPLLLDFGSARHAMGEVTKTLTAMVSPGYAPIEQYGSDEDKQGPWTDIYGLGATLYRAVTGHGPVDAAIRVNGLLSGADVLHPAVDAARGKYSQRTLQAIDAALQIRPLDRPRSIGEWRALLPTGSATPRPEPVRAVRPVRPVPAANTELDAPTRALTRAPSADLPTEPLTGPAASDAQTEIVPTSPTTERLPTKQRLQDQLLQELEEWKAEHDREIDDIKRAELQRRAQADERRKVEEIREEHAYADLLDAVVAEPGTGTTALVRDHGRDQQWEKFKLTEAVQRASDEEVLAMLASGANPTLTDPRGLSPLHYARSSGRIKLAKLLPIAIRVWKKRHGEWRPRNPVD